MKFFEVSLIIMIFKNTSYLFYDGLRIKAMGWASCLDAEGNDKYFVDMDISHFKAFYKGTEIIFNNF